MHNSGHNQTQHKFKSPNNLPNNPQGDMEPFRHIFGKSEILTFFAENFLSSGFFQSKNEFFLKSAQNHLKCREKWFLGIFGKMHILHILCILCII